MHVTIRPIAESVLGVRAYVPAVDVAASKAVAGWAAAPRFVLAYDRALYHQAPRRSQPPRIGQLLRVLPPRKGTPY